MKRLTRNLLLGYGGFCVVNALIAYQYSSAKGYVPGTNALADLNNKLLPLNVLAPVIENSSLATNVPVIPATLIPTG